MCECGNPRDWRPTGTESGFGAESEGVRAFAFYSCRLGKNL